MDTPAIVGLIVVLVVVGGIVWLLTNRKRKTEALQSRYGPEYSRTVSEVGNQQRAEEELVKRKERVEALNIRSLPPDQRGLYAQQWKSVQALFVDDPGGAVTRADGLVEEVMKTRGYPVSDFDQRAADLSVHHARVVQNYRAAREIAERHRRGVASTEDLRKAMVHYRELFEDLLEDREHETDRAADRSTERAVERDVSRSADRPPRTDDRVRVNDNQRRDRANQDTTR